MSDTKMMLAMGDVMRVHLEGLLTKYAKQSKAAFFAAEDALISVAHEVEVAEEEVKAAHQKVHDADAVQDALVLELATVLPGSGFDRINPFREFGGIAPSDFVKQGDAREATAILRLTGNIMRHTGVSEAAKKIASAARDAAIKTQSADAARTIVLAKRAAAYEKRADAERQWSVAMRDLRTTIAYGDYVDRGSQYEAVFGAIRAMKKKKKSSAPDVADPETTADDSMSAQ